MGFQRYRKPTVSDFGMTKHDEDHDCLCDEDLPFAKSMHLSPIEVFILDIARCFCHGCSSGTIGAWDHAFQLGDERLGPADGPAFIARVFAFMRAVMQERRRGLGFMPVGCCRICADERTMMLVVRGALEVGSEREFNSAVRSLIGAGPPVRTLLAARALGALCLRYETLEPVGVPAGRGTRTLN